MSAGESEKKCKNLCRAAAASPARQPLRGSDASDSLCAGGIASDILASLRLAVAVFDRELRAVYVGKAAEVYISAGQRVDDVLGDHTDGRACSDWGRVLMDVLDGGQTFTFSAVAYSWGGAKSIVNICCVPVAGHEGELGMVTIEDVTDRVAADTELAQHERMAALGRIAGKVAHELNNPMDGILRYISLAVRAVDGDNAGKAKEYLGHCRTGLLRMAGIITQLLEFSRSTNVSGDAAGVVQIVEDALKSLERQGRGVEVELVDKCEGELKIRAGNLYQVFCNIIKNAFDAMEGEGKLTIAVATESDLLRVSFADTGCGLPAEGAQSVFKPFFTTKAAGRGTGLGLCVCKELIEKLSGEITAENNKDGGCTFVVTVPVARLSVE